MRLSRRAQLRTRVMAGVLAVTLIAVVAFDFAAVAALRGYLVGQTDSRLHTVLNLYRPVHPLAGVPQPAQQQVIAGPRLRLPGILAEYSVVFSTGREWTTFVRGSPVLLPAPGVIAPVAARRAITVFGRGQVQLRLVAVHEAGGTLVATTSLGRVDSTVGRLELILAIGSAAAVLLVALGVGAVMRRGLRPIEAMAAQADRISAGELTHRVGPQDPGSEVGRLGAAINGMLARIESAIGEREASQELTRRFFADASHELRNPLASLRANAELYQQGALTQPGQIDQAMHRIAAEAQRMSVLVDDMLRLARLDQHPSQRHDLVDLTDLVAGCAERARAASPGWTWHTQIAANLGTTGDAEMLRRAVDNLLANVRVHTPPGTTAAITAAGVNGAVAIEVSDDGPGVPPARLSHIFDRFYRATAQPQCTGSGLGLAIVAAIAAAHDGAAKAAPNDPHGLTVTLTLPASSAATLPASSAATLPASSPATLPASSPATLPPTSPAC